ncbi:hypothetical protein Q7P36_005559 [Cladosporium allicinum]
MLSTIKTSLCSVLLLATYATAASQSAINLEVKYCSKENTGASNDQGSNIYQSLGACNDLCQGKFAYAVLQYQECYCSNEKPAEEVSLESCNQGCPGYPDQKCGNKGAGLFAYVALDGAPISGSETTSTSSSTSNSTMPAMTSAAGTNSSSAGTSGHSTDSKGNSTSDSDEASYTGASSSLTVPLAMSAILGAAMSWML